MQHMYKVLVTGGIEGHGTGTVADAEHAGAPHAVTAVCICPTLMVTEKIWAAR